MHLLPSGWSMEAWLESVGLEAASNSIGKRSDQDHDRVAHPVHPGLPDHGGGGGAAVQEVHPVS